MKTTVWYLLVICLIKVKEMVDYIFAHQLEVKTNDLKSKKMKPGGFQKVAKRWIIILNQMNEWTSIDHNNKSWLAQTRINFLSHLVENQKKSRYKII